MKKMTRASLAAASTLMLTALLAACGGGGGGGGTTPPTTGGGGSTPTPVTSPTGSPTTVPPTTAPPPTPSPGATGALMLNGSPLASATVAFTCGCTGDAGKIQTDATGNFTINGVTGAPSALNSGKTYVPSGHNLLVVGYANAPSKTQTWTMLFLGNTPAHNLTLSNSDVAATAASLYVYYAASIINNNADKTFDWFNFNQILAFTSHLRQSPDATEQKFLTDVANAQTAGQSLFPVGAAWNTAISSDGTNGVIYADVQAVAKDTSDSTVPTQCTGSLPQPCTGAPTP